MLFYGTEVPPNNEEGHLSAGKNGGHLGIIGNNNGVKNGLRTGNVDLGDDVSNHLDTDTTGNRIWKDQATRRDDVTRTTMDPMGGSHSGCISSLKPNVQCIGSLLFIIFTSSWGLTFQFWDLGHLIISFSVLPVNYLINMVLNLSNEISLRIPESNALIYDKCIGDFINELTYNKTDVDKTKIKTPAAAGNTHVPNFSPVVFPFLSCPFSLTRQLDRIQLMT